MPQATASSTLLASSNDSRETASKPPPVPTRGARNANSNSDPPMTNARNTE